MPHPNLLVPFEIRSKIAPKKVLVTLFPYIFLLRSKWNIVNEYLKIKIFSRDTNIFGRSATTIGGFGISPKTSGCSTGSFIYIRKIYRKTNISCWKNLVNLLNEWFPWMVLRDSALYLSWPSEKFGLWMRIWHPQNWEFTINWVLRICFGDSYPILEIRRIYFCRSYHKPKTRRNNVPYFMIFYVSGRAVFCKQISVFGKL